MDGQFQDILNGLPEKRPCSRLEPHETLIDELRRRGRTFREIADILAEECHVETAASTIHDFVRMRSRKELLRARPNQQPQPSRRELKQHPAAKTAAVVDEVRRKIAALKIRKSVIETTPEGFQFDPSGSLLGRQQMTALKPWNYFLSVT